MSLQVGDKVVIEPTHRRTSAKPTTGTVTAVARKYATVTTDPPYPHEQQFDKETGYERSDRNGFMASSRALTEAQRVERDERKDLVERLRKAGLRFEYRSGEDAISTATLRAVVAAIEAAS